MKNLLVVSAVVEIVTGLALLAAPSLVASILLGVPLDNAAGLIVARIAGAGLLSLGVACWLASLDERSRATAGVVVAMLFYDVIATVVLVYARVGGGFTSMILWLAALAHALLAVWCAIALSGGRKQP